MYSVFSLTGNGKRRHHKKISIAKFLPRNTVAACKNKEPGGRFNRGIQEGKIKLRDMPAQQSVASAVVPSRRANRSKLPSPGKVRIHSRKEEKIHRSVGGAGCGWYIADQYNCTLVLINNRRWEQKKARNAATNTTHK